MSDQGKVRVTWQVSDGYAGGSRPQETEIDADAWLACGSGAEREELVAEWVEEDFKQSITWDLIDVDVSEVDEAPTGQEAK